MLFRPDAALLLGALALYWISTVDRTERWKLILAVTLAAAPAVALAIFQRSYYGSWIPNTATLKRSAGVLSVYPGVEYVLVSVFRYPFNAVALIGAIFGASRLPRRAAVLLSSLAGGYLVDVARPAGIILRTRDSSFRYFRRRRFSPRTLCRESSSAGYAAKIYHQSCRRGDDRSDRL